MEAIQKLFPPGQTNSDRTVAGETRRQDGPTFEEALREGALDAEPATSPRGRDGATRAPEAPQAPAATRKETQKDVDVDAEDHPDGVQGLTTNAARVDAPAPGRSFGEGTAAAPSMLQGEPVATARATPGAGSIPVDGAHPGKTVAPETTIAHGAATTTTTTTHIPTKEGATQASDSTSGSFSSLTPSGGINAAVAAAVGTAAAAAAVANRGADAVTLAADPSAPDRGSPAEGTASAAPTPASRPDHSAGDETREDGKRGSSPDQGNPVLEATTPPPDLAKVQTTAGDGNASTSTLAATGTAAPQSATGVRPGATALPPVIEPSTGQVSLERILDQVKIRLAPQRPEVTIVLDPPELGRLHLRLSMHKGALSATVTADDPRVTRAFEADLGRLVRTLDEAGIRVGSVEIRTELSQSHDQGRGGRNDTHQASQEDQHRDARSLNKAVRTAVAPPPSVAGMSRTIAKTRSTLDLVV